ncbi:MAG TPA: twin-arginine translocation signal domain-containing protein [Thermoplasmata archaeon]|nr:twin-arginine translocation signal domain-containing protein [Thermoplasmata archaeon]
MNARTKGNGYLKAKRERLEEGSMTMSATQDFETDAEESSEPSRSTRKAGFFARRRARKEALRREMEHAAKRDAHVRKGRREPATVEVLSRANDGRRSALGKSGPRRVDLQARKELEDLRDRRDFLRKSAIGAGILALGAGVGYGSGYAHATGLSGNTRTVITDSEVAARVIGGVRIATEFIPDPVPAGTDADPYPGSAIQAALNDGFHVYVPAGTWRLTSTISRPVGGATIIGAGRSTKLVFNGTAPCISAGSQSGWLIANLAVDAGGVDVSLATETRFSEVWVNGVLTDNRPIGSGSSGTGGYYGVRAADFITSGDGSPANPYNASAIQNAVNSLPSRGGVVFIKAGVWRGTSRIQVPGSPTTEAKIVTFVGEGMEGSIYGFSGGAALQGTHVQAGFDCYNPTNFTNLTVSPHPNNTRTQPCIKYIITPANPGSSPGGRRWLTGFFIRDVRLWQGDPGLWMTGVNMGNGVWQMWQVVVERVSILECNRGVLIDEGDGTAVGVGILRANIRQLKVQHCLGGRAFDCKVTNVKGEWGNILIESTGDASTDYAFYLNSWGSGGLIIQDIDFGDANATQKDAYINSNGRGDLMVHNLTFNNQVDIGGTGYFRVGSTPSTSRINIINAQAGRPLIVERIPNRTFILGTVSGDKTAIKIVDPDASGFVGSTLAGASPYTYTNLDMCDEMVYLVGGTITGLTRDGQSIGTDRSHSLRPGDGIVISHSAAPTIKRFRMPM